VYVLRDQGCVCALDFRGECGGDVHARDPAAEARGRASPPTTADAGPAGARGTGPDPG